MIEQYIMEEIEPEFRDALEDGPQYNGRFVPPEEWIDAVAEQEGRELAGAIRDHLHGILRDYLRDALRREGSAT